MLSDVLEQSGRLQVNAESVSPALALCVTDLAAP